MSVVGPEGIRRKRVTTLRIGSGHGTRYSGTMILEGFKR
jgi:hypothetical protein